MFKKTIFIISILTIILSGCGNTEEKTDSQNEQKTNSQTQDKTEGTITEDKVDAKPLKQLEMPQKGEEIAIIKTSMGDIKVRLFPEDAPKAVESFKTHAKDGYYNNLIFHRVFNDFMIQGGDPTGTGTGGESIWKKPFEDEIGVDLHNFRGALSMANAGANTNGSQFFIVQASTPPTSFEKDMRYMSEMDQPLYKDNRTGKEVLGKERFPKEVVDKYLEIGGTPFLDGGNPWPNQSGQPSTHTVFGHVFEGMDVVDAIAKVSANQEGRPDTDVVISTIEIKTFE